MLDLTSARMIDNQDPLQSLLQMCTLPGFQGHVAASHNRSLILSICLSVFLLVCWFVACLSQYCNLKLARMLVYNCPRSPMLMTVPLGLSPPHQVSPSRRGAISCRGLSCPGGSTTTKRGQAGLKGGSTLG